GAVVARAQIGALLQDVTPPPGSATALREEGVIGGAPGGPGRRAPKLPLRDPLHAITETDLEHAARPLQRGDLRSSRRVLRGAPGLVGARRDPSEQLRQGLGSTHLLEARRLVEP